MRFPAGFNGNVIVEANEFRAVVIKGSIEHKAPDKQPINRLLPGSYFGSSGAFEHNVSANEGAVIYIRTNGRYKIVPG